MVVVLQQKLNLPDLITFCCCVRDGSKMVSNIEVQMKQGCVIEFVHREKNGPIDIISVF